MLALILQTEARKKQGFIMCYLLLLYVSSYFEGRTKYERSYSRHKLPFHIIIFKNAKITHSVPFYQKILKFFFSFFKFSNFSCNMYDQVNVSKIKMKNILSEWQLLENATSARGEFWESIFLKHSSYGQYGLVLQENAFPEFSPCGNQTFQDTGISV